MMKKGLIVFCLMMMLSSVTLSASAEGFGALFGDLAKELDTVFSDSAKEIEGIFGEATKEISSIFGESSEEETDQEETKQDDTDSFLGDLETIISGFAEEEVGIPKTIHYGNFELFKKDIDTIETYFQDYVDFMESYDANDLTMIVEYTSFMASYVEVSRIWESLDEKKMTAQEKDYYNKVLLRVNKILYSALL